MSECLIGNLPQISMTAFSSIIHGLVFFLCTRVIDHVAEVIFTLFFKGMLLHQILLIR